MNLWDSNSRLHDCRSVRDICPVVGGVNSRCSFGSDSFVPINADLHSMPTVHVTASESAATELGESAAAELAETLVDERLAACVNAVD